MILERERDCCNKYCLIDRIENEPLQPIKEMGKLERRSADVVIDNNTTIAFVRWKDNKMLTVLSSKYGLNPTEKANGTSRKRKVQ